MYENGFGVADEENGTQNKSTRNNTDPSNTIINSREQLNRVYRTGKTTNNTLNRNSLDQSIRNPQQDQGKLTPSRQSRLTIIHE